MNFNRLAAMSTFLALAACMSPTPYRAADPDHPLGYSDQRLADNRIRVSFRGTHQGEFQGIPATGRTIRYVSHEFYRVTDGRIAEEWICSDTASLFRQLTEEEPAR